MRHSMRLLAILGCLTITTASAVAQAPKADGKKDEGPPKVAAQGAVPQVGEIVADYTFKNLVSGDGRTSMKDFRGNVVLIDWWGFH
jgi:hypothetical protein